MKFIDELNKIINNEIKGGAFPGAHYAIVTKNRIFLGSLGNKANIPEEEKNEFKTLYDMASLTKILSTTTCIYKLIELGKIRTTTSVQKYLPEFKHSNVTIWHLLTHTSGLPEGIPGLMKIKSRDELIERIYNTELSYETGSQIKYSDVGFILLGFIIEKIMDKPLNEVVEELIFKPLNMNNTGYLPKDAIRCAPTELRDDPLYQGMVRGVVHDETSLLLGGVAGHAGLFSNAIDVSKYIQMILNDGMSNGKKYFTKETIDLMYKPQVKQNHPTMCYPLKRGLGWIVGGSDTSCGDLISEKTIHHTGFTGTNIWIDKEREIGFCLLTNRVHPTRVNYKLFDVRGKVANFILSNLDEIKGE